MKIIITESQLTTLHWFLQNKKELDSIFKRIVLDNDNFKSNYVMFRTFDQTMDDVVNRVYEYWAYNHNSFTGEKAIKEYLKTHYSKIVKNLFF